MKFVRFLKDVFVSKFWIKLLCLVLALFVVLVLSL